MKKKFYSTLAKAQQAVILLGISSMSEYKTRYKEDPLLPSNPSFYYSNEWLSIGGSEGFFKTKNKNFYSTFKEAQQATIALGINTWSEYQQRYKEDPRLPSSPENVYSKEWGAKGGYPGLFGKDIRQFYPTLKEARQAVIRLGISTMAEYRKRYQEDLRLPSHPNEVYSNEWPLLNGFSSFLGKKVKDFYPTFAEAQQATMALGITSENEYKKRYREDSRLPTNPDRFYSDEWPSIDGFPIFFGNNIKNFYPSLAEAQEAAILLGIASQKEYAKRHHEDPRLPTNPNRFYLEEWPLIGGFQGFLGKKNKFFYPTFKEAQQAALELGITSHKEYSKRYKEDPRLPANPRRTYAKEWPSKGGYSVFLGKKTKEFYSTYSEAQQAAIALNINSKEEYQLRYKEDSLLPSNPREKYSNEWLAAGGFPGFLGKKAKDYYPTLIEAQQATMALNITSRKEYLKRHKEDSRLPSNIRLFYSKEWETIKSYSVFFGEKVKKCYPTLVEAQQATIALGIRSQAEYKRRYKEDPFLPSNPRLIYSKEWLELGGYPGLFGKDFYPTLAEAKQATVALGIASRAEYQRRHKEDPRLPVNPMRVYAKELLESADGLSFFDQISKDLYPTLAEAQQATFTLGITSLSEYKRRHNEDPRLPASPLIYYKNEIGNIITFTDFFLPTIIDKFYLLIQAVKVLNIKDSKDYRQKRKVYKQLPSQPQRSFPNEFIDWYHLCDIPTPYSYLELQHLVQNNHIKTMGEYKKWRIASGDKRIPSSPHETELYKEKWVNWFVFLGQEEPFQPKYFHEPYLSWRDEINEFMKFAKGGGSKRTYLCKFVRLYVQKYQLGFTPVDFVFNKNINIPKFREFISGQEYQSKIYKAIDELIDYIIRTKCSEEDPDTGELVRMVDAKNRFKGIWLPEETSRSIPDETVKPALSYQYVQALRSWTIPSDAKTFSDLVHLHKFDSEWVTVPITSIDKDDPDCVFEIIDDEFAQIWIPTYWMHAYTLFSVPLRGMQIAYNDSGEADTYLPEYEKGNIVWKKNKGKLAGLTKNQGMIKRYPNNEFGMFSTSNKTSVNMASQSVPWMPIELAYWLIKLRKWQSKYNPVKAPTQWLDCKRTNLNEIQRKQKGANCFLFRDFGEDECGTFGGRLAHRLAAALYFSQPKGMTLATLTGHPNAISKYKSEYTPHSMRVSLITIYVMEYNLDLSIIMKIAGHSSIIMSVYYVKTQGVALRKKIEEGEKIALKSQAKNAQNMIEQLRIEELKPNLVANSKETLNALNNSIPAGNYLFRDWGICPHAGTRCEDGGVLIKNTGLREPTPIGYLGSENCIRCRHFITGPAFLGGLLAIFQEIILQLESKQSHYDDLLADENNYSKELEKEDEKEYICNKKGEKFNLEKRKEIYGMISKTTAEYEVVAKKMDMLYCDLGAVSTLVHQCQALLNKPNGHGDSKEENLQLIVKPDHELQVITEEVSQYELLSEVCENAEIYQSASAELAITPRSQLIDKMMLRNNITPQLFTLTPKQQLRAGNQINRLLLKRLRSRTKINDLIEGKLLLSDLADHERINSLELKNILNPLKIDIKEHLNDS